ncbi:Trp biosynthesis-associated membrane protein [Actinophytocola sp. NPDC049390]|uniref:Trp biosynthesis-associated membrane protein n=1 Tax=Actinophytocola sp. NPDC049390 TaxID=3363894 RepID=UPI003795EF76
MSKRPLWIIAVLLLGAAAALWGAGSLDWFPGPPEPAPEDPGSPYLLEPGTREAPSFTAVAWLALASLAGVFAVGGWMRRLLGAIVVVAGGWVCWRAVDTPGPFELLSGRGVAVLGGVLFLAAGVLVVVHAATLPTMGARYDRANATRRSGDPDKDMWDGLSEGEDPTAEGPRT